MHTPPLDSSSYDDEQLSDEDVEVVSLLNVKPAAAPSDHLETTLPRPSKSTTSGKSPLTPGAACAGSHLPGGGKEVVGSLPPSKQTNNSELLRLTKSKP